MALEFLSGLNVKGNINLNTNQLQNAVIQGLGTDPSGIAGRIYYNSGTNKLKIYNGTDWVAFQTGTDGDTTYDLAGVGSTNGTAGVSLIGSDSTVDNVLVVGAGHITVTRSGNTLTVSGSDTTVGTVTDVIGGTGITITGTSTVTPDVNITYAGAANAILAATTAVPVLADTIWFSDVTDTTIKKALVSALPFSNNPGTVTSISLAGDSGTTNAITSAGTFNIVGGTNVTTSATGTTVTINSTDQYVGTVTSVTAGAGLTQTGTDTINPTILVDYSSTGLIADATAATPNVEADDQFLVSDNSAGDAVRRAKISEMPISVLGMALANVNLNSNKIVNLTDPSSAQDAATKAYVDTSNIGQSIFQGGYNADTNTPDLDVSPATNIKKGWFWAVTDTGDFFTEEVQPGDLIYANQDNPGATFANWTVVQSGQDIAGAAATDGATTKGIAGFSSATFTVTSNGWATVKAGGIILGTQTTGSYNPTVGTDIDVTTSDVDVIDTLSLTDGVITASSTRTLPTSLTSAVGVIALATQAEVDAGTVTNKAVTPATLSAIVDDNSFSGTYPPTSIATWTITAVVHGLGVGPFIVQTYNASTGAQVYTDVLVSPSNGNIVFNTFAAQSINAIRCNIMKIR